MSDAQGRLRKYCDEMAKMTVFADGLHSLHAGTEREAILRISDIRTLLAENERLRDGRLRDFEMGLSCANIPQEARAQLVDHFKRALTASDATTTTADNDAPP